MAVGGGVTEVPDSEDEPMTSSPDPSCIAEADKLCLAAREPIQDAQAAHQAARAFAGSTHRETAARHDCLVNSQTKASNDDDILLAVDQNQTQASASVADEKGRYPLYDCIAVKVENKTLSTPAPPPNNLTRRKDMHSAPQRPEGEASIISSPNPSEEQPDTNNEGDPMKDLESEPKATTREACPNIEADESGDTSFAQESSEHRPSEDLAAEKPTTPSCHGSNPLQGQNHLQLETEEAKNDLISRSPALPSENTGLACVDSAEAQKPKGGSGIEHLQPFDDNKIDLPHRDQPNFNDSNYHTQEAMSSAISTAQHHDISMGSQQIGSSSPLESSDKERISQALRPKSEPLKTCEDSAPLLETKTRETDMSPEHTASQRAQPLNDHNKLRQHSPHGLADDPATVVGNENLLKSSTVGAPATSTSKPGLVEQHATSARTPQERTLAELKAQKSALMSSLATLPRIQELVAETKGLDADAEPTSLEIMDAANKIVKEHIKLLHEYNEMKDAGQGLMGLIADQRGVRIVEVQDEFGIEAKD